MKYEAVGDYPDLWDMVHHPEQVPGCDYKKALRLYKENPLYEDHPPPPWADSYAGGG